MFFFFFNDTATTEIYTLSLHDALPISEREPRAGAPERSCRRRSGRRACERESYTGHPHRLSRRGRCPLARPGDRKSTRLNSSHANISYAVFCLKKKKKT